MARREAAFQAIRDLNFDRQVGKVTEEDFAVFEAHLKQAAAEALRALDEWEIAANRSLDRMLETGAAAQRAESFRVAFRSGTGESRRCPACGRPAVPEDKFCATCGLVLPTAAGPASLACPHCGKPFAAGDRFCTGCGRPLPGIAGPRTTKGDPPRSL
jgi:predicted RNA-binding Zn-ribbon protein involved in translation (DUF1610 family)